MDLEACLEACAWVPQDENCHMAVSKPFKDGLGGKTAASKPAGCTGRRRERESEREREIDR